MAYDIKKLAAAAAAIGALGFGGSALAGAATNGSKAPAAPSQAATRPDEAPDASEQVGGPDAEKASAAALAAVGSGKVTQVAKETRDDHADKPEKGDTPDPAYEGKQAYDVEVTKADGTVTDVAVDAAFKVLGTQADQADAADQADGQDAADGQEKADAPDQGDESGPEGADDAGE